jgi:hypothetical protein
VIKYANWLPRIEAGFFLPRKIIANSCGAAEGILAAAALVWFDEPAWVTAAAVAAYAYGNVHPLVPAPCIGFADHEAHAGDKGQCVCHCMQNPGNRSLRAERVLDRGGPTG